jgi:hypothetical protein
MEVEKDVISRVLPTVCGEIPGWFQTMQVAAAVSFVVSFVRTSRGAVAVYAAARAGATVFGGVAVIFYRGSRQDVYNILWAVVFGFATLNIISLAARRLEPTRRGLSFGELMAVMVVLLSIFLLGWEMLNMFHIFPIQLRH